MRPLRALPVFALLALLLLPAFAAAATTHQVSLRGSRYDPLVLQLKVGDTVTWTHRDPSFVPHTVTASDGSFASPEMRSGHTFTHTFTAPGAVTYQCLFHPTMVGVLVIQS